MNKSPALDVTHLAEMSLFSVEPGKGLSIFFFLFWCFFFLSFALTGGWMAGTHYAFLHDVLARSIP